MVTIVNTQLPAKAEGIYRWNNSIGLKHDYATARTIEQLLRIAKLWSLINPSIKLGIGHLSLLNGTQSNYHAGHRDGRQVDVRPFRIDHQPLAVNWQHPTYSRLHTQQFLRLLVTLQCCTEVFFNDPELIRDGLSEHLGGHDDHMHLEFLP